MAASDAMSQCATARSAISEHQLCRELNLPGRARLTGRQARPGDPAERGAADDVARRAEVGMVEQVEHVGAKLQPRAGCKPHVLDDREVCVVESRADYDVPPQVAETIHGHEHRWIEPLIDGADDMNGA